MLPRFSIYDRYYWYSAYRHISASIMYLSYKTYNKSRMIFCEESKKIIYSMPGNKSLGFTIVSLKLNRYVDKGTQEDTKVYE